MTITIDKAYGYRGDHMHLPVADLDAALPFYEMVLGFHVVSRSEQPYSTAVLARDHVQIGLAENGGDSTQDGCAFHVTGLQGLFDELQANGLNTEAAEFKLERHGSTAFKCFYVVAPDGLCFWFGEPGSDL